MDERVIIADYMNGMKSENPGAGRRRVATMTPLTWALLIVFLVGALLTAYLTFAVVREFYLTRLAPDGQGGGILSILSGGTPMPKIDANTPLQAEGGPTPQPWDGAERVNVLLVGLDFRDWEGGGPSRTDTMILLTLDPASQTAGILSIPRDLWVNIPGYGYGKINTAYYLGALYQEPGGGPGLAIRTVEEFLGLDIHYYAQVDFEAFEQFIDTIGGVEIEISEEISVDPIGPHNTVLLQPGLQVLDGATALAYARNRDTLGGDFDRSQRQQQVIMAIRNRILNKDLMPTLVQKSPLLYQQLSAGVNTNLTLDQAIRLAWLAVQVPAENIKRGAIGPDQVTISVSPEGLDILLPDSDAVRSLRDEIFTTTGPLMPQLTTAELKDRVATEQARVSVLNATYTAGLAANTAVFLQSQGIAVVETGNANEVYELTSIIDYSGKTSTTQYLIDVMKIDPSRIYSRYDPNSLVDIAIVLGADWANDNPMP